MATLQEGYIFDTRYRLIEKLGEGGFAEVWLAEDLSNQYFVALKVYMHSSKLDKHGVESFCKEFALVYNLDHYNLMKYSCFSTCVGYPYLVMPYYDSGSAEELIGKCDEKTAWVFLRDVAAGLACLHEHDPAIIHQDIKPANVLLDVSRYVIADFVSDEAVRRALYCRGEGENSSGENYSMGTMPYMAPEKFLPNSQPEKAGDIWSLGASLYEILTGRFPFGNEGGKAQHYGMVLQPLPETYSWELRNIVCQCLSPEPSKRPRADDLAYFANTQLNRLRSMESPVQYQQPMASANGFYNSGEVSGRRTKRKAVALILLALLVGALVYFWDETKSVFQMNEGCSAVDILDSPVLDEAPDNTSPLQLKKTPDKKKNTKKHSPLYDEILNSNAIYPAKLENRPEPARPRPFLSIRKSESVTNPAQNSQFSDETPPASTNTTSSESTSSSVSSQNPLPEHTPQEDNNTLKIPE